MAGESRVTGQCLCSAVQFDITLPSKWCAHCHCSLCQRSHGAGVVTWVGVLLNQFHLVAGQDQLKWYQSSPEAKRGFCTECGSSMLFQSTRWPDEMHIALASLDGAIDRMPQGHVCFDTHVDWLTLTDDLPHFGGLSGSDQL